MAARRGMIAILAQLDSADQRQTIRDVTGLDIPKAGRFESDDDTLLAWMAPHELLLMVQETDTAQTVLELERSLGSAPSLVQDVSDLRVAFAVGGRRSRDILAKGTPADLSPKVFREGSLRRTRVAQVGVAVWMEREPEIRVLCRRSEAAYMKHWLQKAADMPGPDYHGAAGLRQEHPE